ncbi:ran-binding protein 3-like [Accipiter gentilis]|uniref:ran-binding protein 3-like n=1 Tax=Astur gentilis TaxID=8957 RepID=UPI002110AF36|nr:ran-binding protein 3-like [Accipiter gentilis]XP_049652453.1 ran-binding protein 3-like [Accipiter gentilis]XP_049652455.1 ran-binding protein 3-like [Accipiter gentilis]
MRNQPIPACKGNVLHAGTRRSCAGCGGSVRSRHDAKAQPGLPERPDRPSDRWAPHQAARPQEQTARRSGSRSGRFNPKEECRTERSVLAQPTFVFEKKDRPLKRPAEDLVCKADNDFISCSRKRARSSSFTLRKSDSQSNTDTTVAQKRGRSSSFTILPTFPPSQPVKKNNIFMTSALLQRNPDLIRSTKEGSLSQSQLRNVIRPAILQPPQALACPENPVVSPVTKKEAYVQLSEDRSYSSAENSVSSKTAVRSSTTMNLSTSKTTQSQLFEDESVQNSSNSDFVFGENMVERVLSPEKHPQPCNGADSYNGEITSMYIEPFHVSPQTKTALLRNATLNESAAASICKPVEKILLDKVDVITGEEAEHNVLQINCKLFVFNKLSLTWIERGRGSLRLNDTSSNKCGMLQSRLIMRNQGSLRLILNTRLWDQMVIKRANRKSLCFTATDQEDHSVQVFLIQASSKDTEYLYAAMHHRLVALRSFAEQEPDANQVDAESEIAFEPLNCDSDDEDDEKITQVSSSGYDHSRWNHRQSIVCS